MSTAVSANLKQIFLPYYNIITQEHGWQFGLPPDKNAKGLAGRLAAKSDVSILVLTDAGAVHRHTNQIVSLPHAHKARTGRRKTEPPRPSWAWVPFDFDGTIKYARVVAPKQVAGSVPLSTLDLRYVPAFDEHHRGFFTQAGIEHLGGQKEWSDINDDLILASNLIEDDLTESRIRLGGIDMFSFVQKNGQILLIKPATWAYENQLWSTHLYRIAKVFCTP